MTELEWLASLRTDGEGDDTIVAEPLDGGQFRRNPLDGGRCGDRSRGGNEAKAATGRDRADVPRAVPQRTAAESLNELLLGASQNPRAFSALYRFLWPVVRAHCRRRLRSSEEAEDAAQEVLLKLFKQIAAFDPSRDGRRWVFTLTHFEVLTRRKRQNRTREGAMDDVSWARSSEPTAEDAVCQRELRALLATAWNSLSPRDREMINAIVGRVRVDPSASDATTRKRKQRALARLHDKCRELSGD
jgi:RNA polymerase sigma-70 factor (ECF subfamily)